MRRAIPRRQPPLISRCRVGGDLAVSTGSCAAMRPSTLRDPGHEGAAGSAGRFWAKPRRRVLGCSNSTGSAGKTYEQRSDSSPLHSYEGR